MAHIRETLAEHHARVAQIILALHPAPSLRLIDAALHHDAGEPAVGDVPAPVKRDNPYLAAILDKAEANERERLGCLIELDHDETAWLKLADRLAAIAHVAHTNPAILDQPDWQKDVAFVLDLADGLGCLRQVRSIINAMTA